MILALLTTGCITRKKGKLWEPRVYVGDHEKLAITRQGGQEKIMCKSKDFSDMVCMEYHDFQNLLEKSGVK